VSWSVTTHRLTRWSLDYSRRCTFPSVGSISFALLAVDRDISPKSWSLSLCVVVVVVVQPLALVSHGSWCVHDGWHFVQWRMLPHCIGLAVAVHRVTRWKRLLVSTVARCTAVDDITCVVCLSLCVEWCGHSLFHMCVDCGENVGEDARWNTCMYSSRGRPTWTVRCGNLHPHELWLLSTPKAGRPPPRRRAYRPQGERKHRQQTYFPPILLRSPYTWLSVARGWQSTTKLRCIPECFSPCTLTIPATNRAFVFMAPLRAVRLPLVTYAVAPPALDCFKSVRSIL